MIKFFKRKRINKINAPVKPKVTITEIGNYQFYCPSCQSKVNWGFQERADKCYSCGQKIDWEGFPDAKEDDDLDRNWITEAYRMGMLPSKIDTEPIARYEARVTR